MDELKTVIVDDSSFFRKYLRDILSSNNINVYEEFASGDELLNFLKKQNNDIDLILLDINMPGISGLKLIPYLLELIPEAIIIMISTINDPDSINDALDLGASNYINKDFSHEEILNIIKSTLEINGFI